MMRNIFFVPDLEILTLKVIRECLEYSNVAKDLAKIKDNINHGSYQDAEQFDRELRAKYEMINILSNLANALPPRSTATPTQSFVEPPYRANLREDYWGIICQVAIKAGIKPNLETCICFVEEFEGE